MKSKKPKRIPLTILRDSDSLKRYVDGLPIDAVVDVVVPKRFEGDEAIRLNISQILFASLIRSSEFCDEYGNSITFIKKDIPADIRNIINHHGVAIQERARYQLLAGYLNMKLRYRTPKPRKQERDKEIVRLRDDQGWSFGRIARHFKMKRDAVERAYYRQKDRMKNT